MPSLIDSLYHAADEARPRKGDAFMRDARYALWGTALVLLLIVPPALAGFAGIGWEASQWAGYAGALACIMLAGSPVRPRGSRPRPSSPCACIP